MIITVVVELELQCLQGDNDLRSYMLEVLEFLTSIQCKGRLRKCKGFAQTHILRSPHDVQANFKTVRLLPLSACTKTTVGGWKQFLNEVEILTRLRHRHLVKLYGCTSRHSRELLLVYEFIINGTVAYHLHGRKAKPGSLSWKTRLKIAVEIASALKYLHASDIIHRDVKSSNILLDENFSVKVADFGISRLFPIDVTHVSTAPQGTPGYMDPDYHRCYQLTDKSNVYSFGVVLVELISAKPAVDITRQPDEINLSNMAIKKIQNDALNELVDPSLGYDKDPYVQKMIGAVAGLAFQCLQSDRDTRPSMSEVLEILARFQCGYEVKAEQDISDPPDSLNSEIKWVSCTSASASICS